MKKISLLLIAFFTGVIFAFGSGKPALNIVPINADRVLVAMENGVPTPMEVRVTDTNGRLVFYKSVRRPNKDYKKIYDLSALEDGLYSLTISTDNVRTQRTIELKDNNVVVGELRHAYDPSFIFDNNTLKFSYLNFDQENYNFILYRQGTEVFRTSLGNDFAMTKGFDLSKLDRGYYEAVIASANNEYYHNVRID
jgi:hypothetical protein